ncbi:hypothetical protein [Burkholderia pseudomultivorans]|uniref:Uncharacterized protein n=1 Tax=Burkholderia pseudomultivorans TaxID=1207504 RepID=A0A132EFD0_9BURK|nr:hypothetical protein [Burkholderia pseudomultivorans]KWF29274.1 hypothetical protein WT56_17320 [Burkholderia pseudomultivorans]
MKRHLVIAGTGRAGTTFLVQYLTACGLETQLTKYPEERLDPFANAGLEHLPGEDTDLPYVIKSAWLHEFIERLLSRTDTTIDAVIVPMRDIVEAATSRVTLELRARLGHDEIADECTLWETWGTTPGGVVYSLNPMDQARLLAMGFHHVVHALVKREIPIIFLDFPRLIEDGAYLYGRLATILDKYISRDKAIEAHGTLANPEMVRVGKELATSAQASSESPNIQYPSHSALDRAALLRELKRSRNEMLQANGSLRTAEALLEETRQRAENAEQRIFELEQHARQAEKELQSARQHDLTGENTRLQQENEALRRNLLESQRSLAEILSSTSWTATAGLRRLATALRRGTK